MKRFTYPSLFVVITVLSTASMCKDDEENVMAKQMLATNLGQGTWRVTYFFDQQDKTSDFEGYTFHFLANRILIAKKSALSVQGTWETEDSSEGHTKLFIDLGTSEPLRQLNEDWRVTVNSGSKVTLDHESGGNGAVEEMALERN